MSCCCDSGMNGLMGQLVKAGSRVRVGFEYSYDWTPEGIEAERQGPNWLRSAVVTQLQALGVFSSIDVAVQPPSYQNLVDGYITVQVALKDDQSEPANVGDAAQYAIQTYAPGIYIQRRDQVVIDYIPPAEVGKSGVAQVTPRQQTNQNVQQPSQSQCNWDTQGFGDYIACQLGITSPFGGIAVGSVGALVGVGVLTLLAVVVLKR